MSDLARRLADALGEGYAIERELGGGGMSRVFVATERALGRTVVVKVLPPDLAGGVSVDRFRREIQLAARLQHPHIVPLLSAGQGDGLLWYTMPLVRGASLRELLAGGPLPVEQAVTLAGDIADALAVAHREGVMHRDIKPENVLVGDGHALVTDFGVARAVSEAGEVRDAVAAAPLTSVGIALGTPAYMAPEQIVADPAMDGRVDVYALGMVTYEMLTGRLPWTGLSPAQLMGAHLGTPPEPIEALRSDLPAGLAEVVMRALAKDPDARWPDAAAFGRALRAVASGATPGATHASGAPAMSTGRRPPRRIAALLLAAATIAGGAFVVVRRDRAPVSGTAERIAVLPFVAANGTDAELARLGRDLVVTVSSNLERAGAVRTVDALTTLARAGEAPITDEAQRLALGRDLDANGVLHGALVRDGGSVRLDYRLVPVAAGASALQGTVRAPAADIAALSDSLTWSVLRAVWRTGRAPTPSVAEATTSSLDALRAFLDGEQAAVRGAWRDAMRHFERAYALDTTFVLAAFRLRWTRTWNFVPSPPRLDTVIVRGMASLPERDRLMAAADSTTDVESRPAQLKRLTEAHPDYWPGWFRYGDVIAHEGWQVGTGYDEAVRAFLRATRLNPDLRPAHGHIALIAKARDSAIARQALAAIDSLQARAGRPRSGTSFVLRHDTPLERSAESAERWVRAFRGGAGRPAANPDGAAMMIAHDASFGRPGFATRLLEGAMASMPELERAAGLRQARAASLAMAGRWEEAVRWIGGPPGEVMAGPARLDAYVFDVMGSWLAGLDARHARAVRPDDAELSAIADAGERARSIAARAWADGVLGIATGDRRAVDAARGALRAQRTLPGSAHLRSLAALDLGARGERAAAAESLWALAVERMHSREQRDAVLHVHGLERVAGGRWLAEQRRFDRAQRLLHIDEWMVDALRPTLVLIPASGYATYERARAYEAAGDRDNAIDRYEQVLRIHELPESGDSAIVAESRRALERLRRGR